MISHQLMISTLGSSTLMSRKNKMLYSLQINWHQNQTVSWPAKSTKQPLPLLSASFEGGHLQSPRRFPLAVSSTLHLMLHLLSLCLQMLWIMLVLALRIPLSSLIWPLSSGLVSQANSSDAQCQLQNGRCAQLSCRHKTHRSCRHASRSVWVSRPSWSRALSLQLSLSAVEWRWLCACVTSSFLLVLPNAASLPMFLMMVARFQTPGKPNVCNVQHSTTNRRRMSIPVLQTLHSRYLPSGGLAPIDSWLSSERRSRMLCWLPACLRYELETSSHLLTRKRHSDSHNTDLLRPMARCLKAEQ